MPIRIQRKRIKGWKKPNGAINCTRPGKWGNPFKIGGYYKISPMGFMSPCISESIEKAKKDGQHVFISNNQDAVNLYEKYIQQLAFPPKFSELKGSDLMCFCALDHPCHVDFILKIANENIQHNDR